MPIAYLIAMEERAIVTAQLKHVSRSTTKDTKSIEYMSVRSNEAKEEIGMLEADTHDSMSKVLFLVAGQGAYIIEFVNHYGFIETVSHFGKRVREGNS